MLVASHDANTDVLPDVGDKAGSGVETIWPLAQHLALPRCSCAAKRGSVHSSEETIGQLARMRLAVSF